MLGSIGDKGSEVSTTGMLGLSTFRLLLALVVLTAVVATARRHLSHPDGSYARPGTTEPRGLEGQSDFAELHSSGWRLRVLRAELAGVQRDIENAEAALAANGMSPAAPN